MPMLRRNGEIVAVLSDRDYRLAPTLEALAPEHPERLSIEQTCETLLNARAAAGTFDRAIPRRRS
jgi:hypothetical protein